MYGDGDPLRVLRAARRPVILAGIAALRCAAGPELLRLAEMAGIPVVVSPMAKGLFPEDHPSSPACWTWRVTGSSGTCWPAPT